MKYRVIHRIEVSHAEQIHIGAELTVSCVRGNEVYCNNESKHYIIPIPTFQFATVGVSEFEESQDWPLWTDNQNEES